VSSIKAAISWFQSRWGALYRRLLRVDLFNRQKISDLARENTFLKLDIARLKNLQSSHETRLTYEEGLSRFSQILLRASANEDSIPSALTQMLNAAQVSRCHVWMGQADSFQEPLAKLAYEVCAPGIKAQMEDPSAQTIHLGRGVFKSWLETLKKGEPIRASVESLESEARARLEARDVKSFLLIPIFVFQKLHAAIGFDDCLTQREWTPEVIHLLTVAAQIFGNYIERKRTEEWLWQERNHSAQIINTSPLVILGLKPTGRITFVNPAGEHQLGYRSEEIIDRNAYELFFSADPQAPLQTVKARLLSADGKTSVIQELKLLTKTRESRVFRWHFIKRRDQNGNLVEIIGFGSDVTEQKSLDKMKDEFVGVVSHELRSPVAVIMASISTLKEEHLGSLNEDQAKIVDILSRQTARLHSFINSLLDLSRMESGTTHLNLRHVDLCSLVKEMAQSAEAHQNPKIRLITELPSHLPLITADEDMVVQVISNLLSNALRYAKSSVAMGIKQSREEGLTLYIRDDGEGIAPQDIPKLFNKFVQIKRPAGAGYKGTGLGLAICKEIMKLHHGNIWVESQPGKSCTIFAFWPLNGPEESEHAHKTVEPIEKTK
jgi:PAS domain S-box-containing protein